MPPPLPSFVAAGYSLPEHCEPSSPFLVYVSSLLNSCIPTPLAFISSALGTLSIVSWLFAQLPQIYKNYKLKSTSGLSIYFLVEWCLGDSSNVVGAILTRQAGWQVFVAAYYVLVDVTLVVQFYWYTYFRKYEVDDSDEAPSRRDGGMPGVTTIAENRSGAPALAPRQMPTTPTATNTDTKSMNTSLTVVSPTPIEDSSSNININQLLSYPNEKKYRLSKPARSSPSPPGGITTTRMILVTSMLCAVLVQGSSSSPSPADPNSPKLSPAPSHTPVSNNNTAELVGMVFSWLSTALYLFSRPPQLYKNYVRQSTAGLSPLLFTAAFSGNLFYSASLLTNPFGWSSFPPYGGGGWADGLGSDRADWIARTVPFFLGAFCVLFMDGFMGVQFLMYGSHEDYDCINDGSEVNEDEDDDIARRADDNKEARRRCIRVSGWTAGDLFPFLSKRCGHGRGFSHGGPASMPGLDHERTTLLGIERDNGRYGAV